MEKAKIVEKHAKHAKDTGSSEVQIALLTQRINEMSEHLLTHKKDNNCKRSLITTVSKRQKLLNYLKDTNLKSYKKIIEELKIRISVK